MLLLWRIDFAKLLLLTPGPRRTTINCIFSLFMWTWVRVLATINDAGIHCTVCCVQSTNVRSEILAVETGNVLLIKCYETCVWSRTEGQELHKKFRCDNHFGLRNCILAAFFLPGYFILIQKPLLAVGCGSSIYMKNQLLRFSVSNCKLIENSQMFAQKVFRQNKFWNLADCSEACSLLKPKNLGKHT